ncbi:MAG: transglycosylase SLT domain-containing protein [Candidatus Gastranaerophilales bacterium]|nr:transglycosylase SLT domain-containing protein [Candidatus Gastranaerophilales bacterium]
MVDFKAYLQKVGIQGNKYNTTAAGKQNTDLAKSLSLFSSASLDKIKGLDLEKLLSGADIKEIVGENATDEDAALVNMIQSFISIDEVQAMADADGNEEISEAELTQLIESIIGKDGNNGDLSMDDINNVLKELGVDLEGAAEKAVEEALKEENDKKVEEQPAKETPKASGAGEAGGAGGAGGVGGGHGAGGAGRTGGAAPTGDAKKPALSEAKGETAEQIQQDIDTKNSEIEEIEKQADQEIEEKEKEKENAMKNNGVSDEEYEAYKEKEQELENQIKGKDDEIHAQDDIISDAKSSIDSNKNFMADIDSQISENEASMSEIAADDENGQAKQTEIQGKIDNLKQEKEAKEQENQELEQKISEAEAEKTKLEGEKQQLEEQKQNLLSETLQNSEGFCKGMPEEARKGITKSIKNFDEDITKIRNEKNEKVQEAKTQITELQTKLKDAQAKEEREATLRENSVYNGSVPEELAAQIDAKNGAGFTAKVEEIAKRLNCDPADLLGMMYSESGLNSKAVNGSSGSTGLIQFMPSTAQGLGTSTAELAAMSPIEQLDYVEKFYESNLKAVGMNDGRHIEAGTLYALAFLPAYANREVLTVAGEKYYNANSGLDTDGNGDISTSDLTTRVRNKYQELLNSWT